jgi:hypothetical protein
MKETDGKAKAARIVSRVQHQGERTVKMKREDSKKKIGGRTTAVDGRRRERLRKKKMRRGRWERPVQSYI